MCQDPASAACCLEVPPGLTHWVLSQSLSQDCAEPPGWAAGGGHLLKYTGVSSQRAPLRWPCAGASEWGQPRCADTGIRLSKEAPLGRVTEEPELGAAGAGAQPGSRPPSVVGTRGPHRLTT